MAPPVEINTTSDSAAGNTTTNSRANLAAIVLGLLVAGTAFVVFAYNVSQSPDKPIPSTVPLNQGQQAPAGPTGKIISHGAVYAAELNSEAGYSAGNNVAQPAQINNTASDNSAAQEIAETMRANREDEIREGNTLRPVPVQQGSASYNAQEASAMQYPLDAFQTNPTLPQGNAPDAVISQAAPGGARVNIAQPAAAPINPQFVVPLLGLPQLPAQGTLEMAPVNASGQVIAPIPVRQIPPAQQGYAHSGTRGAFHGAGQNAAFGGGGIGAIPGTSGGPGGFYAQVFPPQGLSGSGGLLPGGMRTAPILPGPTQFLPFRFAPRTTTTNSGGTTTTTTTSGNGTTTTTTSGPTPTP